MSRLITITCAILIDLLFGDPPNRFHPVVMMGNWLSWGRKLAPQRHRFWFGLGWILAGLGLVRFGGNAILQYCDVTMKRYFSVVLVPYRIISGSFLLKSVMAYRNLRQAVISVGEALEVGDVREARRLLSWHLVSRDTRQLTEEEIIGATIESLSENITDSVTAPLLAYALGGLSAAWSYRLVNTADAMWGYRNEEFEQLGKFPARLDDLLNWIPARLTGWLIVVAAWLIGLSGRNAAQTMCRQHGRTSSPNAGWTMSATAGALRVTLTKRDVYSLEGGSEPLTTRTIHRALRLADVTIVLVVVVSCLVSLRGIRSKTVPDK